MRRVTLSSLWLSFLLLLTLTTSSSDAQGETVRIVVYRSSDSLTLYLPDAGFPDITGLYIEATTAIGETVRRDLALLPAFRGVPYNRLPTPICFHIISVSSATLPLDCQTITTITQVMVVGDVFWHEQGDRTLVFYLGEIPQICPAGAPRCTLVFPALPTPTLIATNTPTNTPTATATVTATFTPTNTPIFTFTPTPTHTPIFTQMPTPVNRNEDWEPVEQDFDGVTMVLVPAGCFMMGSEDGDNDEQPVHQVCFDQPFWIDQTEVTNGQYGSSGRFEGSNLPRVNVTWFEARDFCASRDARLPNEAEWEYAARGPDSFAYPWGDSPSFALAVWGFNSGGGIGVVGSIPEGASWVGALDMSGNAWEWVSTSYGIDDGDYDFRDFGEGRFLYPYVEDDREQNNNDATLVRVLRGGSWHTQENYLRATDRFFRVPIFQDDTSGLRCARSYGDGLESVG